jgi:transketolase C-terminal domain/subunit
MIALREISACEASAVELVRLHDLTRDVVVLEASLARPEDVDVLQTRTPLRIGLQAGLACQPR